MLRRPFVALCAVLPAVLCARPTAAQGALDYTWQALAPGVWLSGPADPFRGPVDGNAVVIVTDRDVVVVDTHVNPAAARLLVRRIRAVTDKPVAWIVNTHWHDDHTNGNETLRTAFPDATIVAHRATASALREQWAPFEASRLEAYQRVADVDLEAEARRVQGTDPFAAAGIRLYAQYRDALLPELPDLDPVYPDLTFEDGLVLERGDRTIEIRWLGEGNTAGDAVVWLPADGVLIAGDLVVHPVPYAYEVAFGPWIATLARLTALHPRILVPGHGTVQRDTAYVARLVALFTTTVAEAEAAMDAGADLDGLNTRVRLDAEATVFAGDDPAARYAFETYYRLPALASLWKARVARR